MAGLVVNAQADKTDFSGTWNLNAEKSIQPQGDSKSVAKWSSDGKSLTIETSRTMYMKGESVTMKSTETRILTDAKTLTVVATRQGPNVEVKNTMVYDKKQYLKKNEY